MALAGCATDQTPPVQIVYPAALFQCKDIPDGTDVKTDDDVANYILSLGVTAKDCKDKLTTVGQMVNLPPVKK